ncbi:hypothetical protein SM139_1212, partial [Stenotrophomonas maltophilia]
RAGRRLACRSAERAFGGGGRRGAADHPCCARHA